MKEGTWSSTKEQKLPTLARKPAGNTTSPAQVRLVSTVRLPAYHSAIVPVQVEELSGSVLIKQECSLDDCLQVDKSLVRVSEDGLPAPLIINNGKSSCQLRSGVELAQAYEVDLELTDDTSGEQVSTSQLGDSTEMAEGPEKQTFQQMSPHTLTVTMDKRYHKYNLSSTGYGLLARYQVVICTLMST